jgi:hypothetical protein
MNRILRGAVVLAASALFAGCNTEPEETQGGDPADIVINPASIFVDRGDSNAVLIRLVDQQGTSLNTEVSITNVSPGLSISIDSLFRPIFNPDGTLQADTRNTELRIFVRGVGLEAGSFTVNAGGLSEEVPVTVTPIAITPAVSNAAPSIGEVVTITAEAGLTFTELSQLVSTSGTVGYQVGLSPDGTTLSVVMVPGFSGDYTITNVIPAYAPTLQVDLPSETAITTAATVGAGIAGTDALETAPTLRPLDANGTGVVDVGDTYGFDVSADFGAPAGTYFARMYKLEVLEDGSYDITLDFDSADDLGAYLADEGGALLEALADNLGGGGSEFVEDHHIAPGTYYVAIVTFGGPPTPYFEFNIVPHPE